MDVCMDITNLHHQHSQAHCTGPSECSYLQVAQNAPVIYIICSICDPDTPLTSSSDKLLNGQVQRYPASLAASAIAHWSHVAFAMLAISAHRLENQ